MFKRRSAAEPAKASVVPPGGEASPAPADANAMALDTLASALRAMAEFPLEQEKTDLATFRQLAERWAQHVVIAAPAPGVAAGEAAPAGARRDWQGVRSFVREYCRSSAGHAASITKDLRDVIWVFVRSLSQSFAQDEASDEKMRELMARLEKLVEALTAADLKREVTRAVAEGRDPASARARDVMVRGVPAVGLETPAAEVERMLRALHVHHLPVVGERGLLGVVSLGDVARFHAARERAAERAIG